MTFEDVKRIRENPTAEDVDNAELHKMIDLAIEKQIPKKVTFHKSHYRCPLCNDIVVGGGFCKYCGQALDWGDWE